MELNLVDGESLLMSDLSNCVGLAYILHPNQAISTADTNRQPTVICLYRCDIHSIVHNLRTDSVSLPLVPALNESFFTARH